VTEALKGYNLKGQTVNWGTHDFDGFGENNAFSIEPVGDRFTFTEGVDGSAARAATGSRLFIVKINLLQTSASNAFCAGIHAADLLDDSGIAGVLPFIWKDKNGLDLFFSPTMSIIKPPTIVRSNKVESQEWEFRAADGKLFPAGATLLGLLP
jgi:hypothetical protein